MDASVQSIRWEALLWMAQTVLDVAVRPDRSGHMILTLSQPCTRWPQSLVQTVKSRASTYVELSDGFALNIPAGAFSELCVPPCWWNPRWWAHSAHSGIQ